MQNTALRIFFVVPPEVQLLDIAGPAHVFYEAREYGASITPYYLSMRVDETEARSSAGLSFSSIQDFRNFSLDANDLLFVPGLESSVFNDEVFQIQSKPFYNWLGNQYKQGAMICSVCTGAYVLAEAGLLDGRSCTTHWKYLEDFGTRYPNVILRQDRLFVKDGNLFSSAGVSSGIDLSLYLLEQLYDPVFATQIAKEIVVYLRRTESDPQLSVFLQYRNHIENRVHLTQDFLAQHLSEEVKIERLADEVHMSPRNLTRLFKKTTGITIGQYHDQLRVERAIQLLSEGNKVENVSKMCGLNSANQLRTILKKYAAILPSELS